MTGQKMRTLLQVARRLRNARLDRAVARFREPSVSIRRVVLLAVTVLWVEFWRRKTDNLVLSGEAEAVMPTVLVFFIASIGWAIFIRWRTEVQDREWVDAVGTTADFLGIAALMAQAFTLLLPYVIFLPLACITAGARYNRRIFLASIGYALLTVGLTAPAGYWASRPVVAVLALALVGGLPLTVYRLLNSLRVMSEQAILESERAILESERASNALQARSRFIATMSHELRTPLNTVVHAATLIDASNLKPADRRMIDLLNTNANVLLHRVNDVLDLAASEAGSLHVARDPFYVAHVFGRVEKVVAHRAQMKRIDLRFEIGEGLDVPAFGDSDRIEQVLTNLVTNAVKYTRPGGTVTATARSTQPADPASIGVEFVVADTGIGIPDAEKPHVFEAFRQAGNQRNEGVGLGLHIADAISRTMGGEFDLPRDNPGGGTIFSWRLRFERCPPDAKVPTELVPMDALAIHRTRVAPMCCLVVDDQEANRAVFDRLLERAGHRALFAEEGYLAVQSLSLGGIDIVFLDLKMPGMTGIEVLQTLHDDADFDVPPIVILSAESDRDVVKQAMQLGAFAYLNKPFATAKVLDILERVSASKKARKPDA